MKAVPDSRVIAESDHIVEAAGYPYLPRDSVRMAWLERVQKPSRIALARTACSSMTW